MSLMPAKMHKSGDWKKAVMPGRVDMSAISCQDHSKLGTDREKGKDPDYTEIWLHRRSIGVKS